MKNRYSRYSAIILLAASFFLQSLPASAQGAFAVPRTIDLKTQDQEILESSIKVSNKFDRYVELTPVVFFLDSKELKEKIDGVKSNEDNLADWIEFYRGVIRLAPGEEKEYPLKVKVGPKARPGVYYAYVVFYEGKNFAGGVDSSAVYSQLAVLIRLEYLEKKIEAAELKEFGASKNVYLEFPVRLSFKIDNIGSEPLAGSGFLRIYNRRGEEITSFSIDQKEILPTESRRVEQIWDPGAGFGKYKAKLMLEYGSNSRRDLQDVIFFWILPWKFLAVFSGAVVLIFLMFIYLMVRRFKLKKI